jgi:hypothetical protein
MTRLTSGSPQPLPISIRQGVELVGGLLEVVLEAGDAGREALVAGGREAAQGVVLLLFWIDSARSATL